MKGANGGRIGFWSDEIPPTALENATSAPRQDDRILLGKNTVADETDRIGEAGDCI